MIFEDLSDLVEKREIKGSIEVYSDPYLAYQVEAIIKPNIIRLNKIPHSIYPRE